MGPERRVATRHVRNDFPIAHLESGLLLEPRLAFIRDASKTGLGLEIGYHVVPGETLRFVVRLPAGMISGTAKVRWVSEQDSGCRCGVHIQRIRWQHKKRLLTFLDEKLPSAWERVKEWLELRKDFIAKHIIPG